MSNLPSFFIIGAMKSATSSLYEQLIQQPGIFMPKLKEPNFFSNDEHYSRGLDWYGSLFDEAKNGELIGEASTHYTKLPTYPKTIERLQEQIRSPRLIYVLRHPIERLVSQYVHQWSEGEIECNIDEAVERHPELISYSCYAKQLEPYIKTFGKEAILPVFMADITNRPQEILEEICWFIGHDGEVEWKFDLAMGNVSAQRLRKFPHYDLIIENSVMKALRRRLVPKFFRTWVRSLFIMKEKPVLSKQTIVKLEKRFNTELKILGDYLGCIITCANFNSLSSKDLADWHSNR